MTGIISLPEKSKIITVGWNRKILVYYDDMQVKKEKNVPSSKRLRKLVAL